MKPEMLVRLLMVGVLSVYSLCASAADGPGAGSVPQRATTDTSGPQKAASGDATGADAPGPRPVTACAIPVEGEKGAAQAIQDAVDAVYAAAAPGAGKPELNELSFKLLALASAGENNPPICDRKPIDKLALDGSRFRKSRGETVLTAAADTGNLDVLKLTLSAVKLAGGDVYASDYCGNSAYQLLPAGAPADLRAQLNPSKYNLGRLNDCGDHTVPLAAKADANPPNRSSSSLPFTIQALSSTSPVAPDTTGSDEPIRIPGYITSLLNANQGVSLSAQNSHGVNTPSFSGELRLTPNRSSSPYLTAGHPFVFLNGNIGPKGPGNSQFISSGVGWTSSYDVMPLFGSLVSQAAQERGNETVTWLTSTYRLGVIQNRYYNENLYYRFANASYTWFVPFPHRFNGGYYLYGALTAGAQVQDQYGSGSPTAAELNGGTYSVPRSYTFGRLDLHGYPCGLISPLYTCPAAISRMTFYGTEQWVSGYSEPSIEFGATFPLPFQKGISLVVSRIIGRKDPLSSFGVAQSDKVVQTNVALSVSFP